MGGGRSQPTLCDVAPNLNAPHPATRPQPMLPIEPEETVSDLILICEFPKIRRTILVVPIIRIIVFRGLHRGPRILGNSHLVKGRLV